MRSAEVIVVGAGPAGTTAALSLRRLGVDVLLLDKANFPRVKPCGGGLSLRLGSRFRELFDRLAGEIPIHPVHSVVIESPGGHSVTVSDPEGPLYHLVHRPDMDHALLRLARAAGATVVEGTKVLGVRIAAGLATVDCSGGESYTAQVVIGADGVNSTVARATGLRRGWPAGELAVVCMEETPVDRLRARGPDAIHVFYGYRGLPGYAYLFPKKGTLDFGMGCLRSSFRQHTGGAPYRFHLEFFRDLRKRGLIEGESVAGNFRVFPVPLTGPLSPSYADRVMLCGDAAGFVNAFTAEGIFYSMVSGDLAGRTAAEALSRGECGAASLAGYERLWQAEIGRELAVSRRIGKLLFGRQGLTDRLVCIAIKDAGMRNLFANIALGRTRAFERPSSVLLPILRSALLGRLPPDLCWKALKYSWRRGR